MTWIGGLMARRLRESGGQRSDGGRRPGRVLAAVTLSAWLGTSFSQPAPVARAAEGIRMPFAAGQPVRIIQGYNGGTHQGRSRYGLDLVLGSGETSGATVVAPVSGRLLGAGLPGAGNGCITILLGDGSGYDVMLCHVRLDRAFARGEAIAQGQRLGTVGAPGTLGNNGTPHVHMELHRRSGGVTPVPFSPPDGLPLEGESLPSTGARSEHGGRPPIVSTNGDAGAPRATAGNLPSAGGERAPALASGPRGEAGTIGRGPAVVETGNDCLRVRAAPSIAARALDCLPHGTAVTVVDDAAPAGGYRWSRLQGLGWAASQYLRPAAPTGAGTPGPASPPRAPGQGGAIVRGTDSCLNVREAAASAARTLRCLPDGTAVTIVEGPVRADGYDWYRLQGLGWAAATYLAASR